MKIKRFTSIFLAFTLLLSVFSVSVFSQEKDAFEPKVYSNANIDEDFAGDCVLVVMDKSVGGVDKKHSSRFFGKFPIKEIVDLTPSLSVILESEPELRSSFEKNGVDIKALERESRVSKNTETFRQILKIVLPTDDKQNVLDVIAELEKVDGIISAEPNYIRQPASLTPTDPQYSSQWALDSYSAGRIKAPEAWAIGGFNHTVRVGVIDSGIAFSHEDLAANINTSLSRDYSKMPPYCHGTEVAGVIGAKWNNGKGIAGVATVPNSAGSSNVQIVGLNAHYYTAYSIAAIDYATSLYNTSNRIHILNASYCGSSSSNAEKQAIADYPGLFVAAAGNNGTNNDNTPIYPASYNLPNIISVGASNKLNYKRASSNYGKSTVHLFAPGENIRTTTRYSSNNEYITVSGTSFAAPHVAGVAALIWSKYPNATTEQVKWAILSSIDRGEEDFRLKCTSSGRLNAQKALQTVATSIETEYGVQYIRNANNNWYLNVSGTTLSCVSNKSDVAGQRWVLQRNSSGLYEIRCFNPVNSNIGRISTSGIANNSNAAISTTGSHNMTLQKNSDGTVTFRSGALALAYSGGSVRWTTYQVGIQTQCWYLETHPISYNTGDIDQNGIINGDDANLVQDYVTNPNVNPLTAVEFYLADKNRDGVVNSADY